MNDEHFAALRNYAVRLLSSRPRSIAEMRGKLLLYEQKYKWDISVCEQVLGDLQEKELLSDEAFIVWWKDQRDSFKPKGERAIRAELQQRGVSRALIDKVLPKESTSDEFEKAMDIARKKVKNTHDVDTSELERKVGGLLSRRGFSWEVIGRVIDSLSKNDYNI